MSNVGVRLEDHNHLKYYISLTRVGTELFIEVFSWGCFGNPTRLKEVILSLPNYSNAKFKKDFNAAQREKIDKGEPVSSFDITLIYKLLQMVCGLKDASDPAWVTQTSDSLEYYFYAIKTKRNEIAHDKLQLSPADLIAKLEELRKLFVKTIAKAKHKYSVSNSKVNNLLSSINSQLDAIRDSPVPLATVAEYQKELLANRRACVISEGGNESTQRYNSVCQVCVAPWLVQGQTVNVAKVFTYPKLKRAQTQILQRQLSVNESYVPVDNILQAMNCNMTQPDVILISGLSGMGKSYLLKFILNRCINEKIALTSNSKFDLVLILECHQIVFSSVSEMLEYLLPRTSAIFQSPEFKQILMSLNLLLLVDDLDTLDQMSFSIFQEFLISASPGTQILASSSREKANDIQRKISALHKDVLFLEIEGIPKEDILPLLKQLLPYVLPTNLPKQDNEAKLCQMVTSKLPQLQDHLRSPEILGLIALSWALAPDRINTSSTVTDIFMLLEDLLIHKVLQNLSRSSIHSISAQNNLRSNLKKYLFSLSDVAASCLRKGKFSIESEGLTKLYNDCQALGLPGDYMISAFLCYTDDMSSGNRLGMPHKVSFPRRSALQYYTAWSIIQTMKDTSFSKTISELLGVQLANLDEIQIGSLQSMMKYLVGMLAALLPDRLQTSAKEIVDLLKNMKVVEASQWLHFIEEAKEEKLITREILTAMGEKWEVEDFAISSTFLNIIKRTKPYELVLTITENPESYPHLLEVLKICGKSHQMRLSLHIYKHFWCEKVTVSDKLLDAVKQGPSPCILEHFAGRLSSSAIIKLPGSLKRLALHVTVDMLESLNSTLPLLKDLQMLYLNLDISTAVDPSTLLPLNISRRPMILSVDIWRITEETIERACNIVKSLSLTYTRLVLRHSDLSADAIRRWVDLLQQHRVTASSVVVGSTVDITDKKVTELQKHLKIIGCNQFLRIKV